MDDFIVPADITYDDFREALPKIGTIVDSNNVEHEVELRWDIRPYNFDNYKKPGQVTIEDFNSNNFVLLYNTSESHKKIAQAAQEMWRTALGIEIGLENVEFQVKLDREKSGDYEISRAGWIGDFMDPMTFLDLWASDSSFNDVNYNNPQYDALLKEAKGTIDQDVRMENMREAEKMLMADMPVIPVYFYTQPYTVKSNVSGIIKVPIRYPVITYADITE